MTRVGGQVRHRLDLLVFIQPGKVVVIRRLVRLAVGFVSDGYDARLFLHTRQLFIPEEARIRDRIAGQWHSGARARRFRSRTPRNQALALVRRDAPGAAVAEKPAPSAVHDGVPHVARLGTRAAAPFAHRQVTRVAKVPVLLHEAATGRHERAHVWVHGPGRLDGVGNRKVRTEPGTIQPSATGRSRRRRRAVLPRDSRGEIGRLGIIHVRIIVVVEIQTHRRG